MPCWFYDKKSLMNTPSIQDGIDHKTECQYRTEGAHLIVQVGSKLELGYNTLATGVVYFHRFYMFHSFKNFSPYITACCCLFLAGKAEETPKKSKEIIKIAKKFLSKERLLLLGKHPREEVMTMEKILLQTIKFDLKVQHPYKFLLKYPKYLKGDQRKKQRMVQMAWTFINDSLCTTLSIQWEPEILAIAVMYLSSKLAKFKVLGWSHRKPSHKYWWEIFVEDLTIQIVEDICHQVLDIYVPLSRYYVKESPVKLEPKKESKISEASKSNSCNAVANAQVAARDLKVENGNSIVLTPPITPAKDPRLQIGCADCCCNINPSNTPVMNTSLISMPEHTKLIPSPSTPTDPPPMDQSLHENSQIVTKPNIGRDPRDVSKYSLSMAKFNPSAMSSPPEPMEIVRNPLFDRGFSNMDKWQSKETEGLENSYNDDNQHGWGRNIGFGSANNNHSDDRSGGGPMRNRNFRNRDTNNYRDYRQNHRRRQGYENDNVNSDDHNENRPTRNRGFGNASSYDNRSHSENRFTGNRGFGNNNNNNSTDDDFKPFGNRGFGNSTNNSMNDDCKPFVKRGFGNNNNNNDNMDNDMKPFGKRGIGNENCTNNGNPNENRFSGRRGFGNRNCDDDRNSNGNRFTGRRGFGNKNGNDDRSFNRFTENRGFGNGNHNDDRTPDDNKLTLNKGFGNSNNDDNKSDETKSFMNRGFGNSNSQNNNYNGNDSRPRMGFNRGNRFQRSDNYPRRFNNNYENDRYSNNNDTNGDTSKYFERRDAPGKMVDKQRFYQPPSQSNNIKVEEEESWD